MPSLENHPGSAPASVCPRCHSSTSHPFSGNQGVCLRCAGERVFATGSHPPIESAEDPADTARASADPARIGAYEIIEELGRGGMGCVYAASQIGLGRIVALKAIPARQGASGLELRFLREAQTIARLRHPHIVAVHDSGRADGYAYFTMDYVEGGDLARRLRDAPLSPRVGAALLHKVAGALAYTHAEGVLHRDLKPSNILLDGDEPRVADFGLAAQLEAGGDLTTTTSVLGTPHYLAPEALRGGTAALSVASDIYALGVILFQILTGRTPFSGASPAELAPLIEGTEPPAPHLLAPGVPRDLETICLQCLERDPARRYRSAALLAEDLRRFLADEAILARPPGRLDRLRRYARRHRTGVLAASAIVVVLVAATLVSTTLAIRARQAERRAAAEAATAVALAGFLKKDLLAQASPFEGPDRNVTLHTVLDRAARKIDGRFPDQPLVAGDLHDVIGQVYDSLGDYDAGQRHLERGLQLRRELLGPEHPLTLESMFGLATLLFDRGRLAEAGTLAERTLQLRRRVLGPEHPDTLTAADFRAVTLRDLDRLEEAEALQTSTLAHARRVLGPRDVRLCNGLRTLTSIRVRQSRVAEAEPLIREAVAIHTAASGPEDPATLAALNDLAAALREQGKLTEAGELHARVLALRRRVLGPEHPHTQISVSNLAGVYKALGRLDEAAELQRSALEINRRRLDPGHQRLITVMRNLADTYRLQKKYAASAELLQEALTLARREHGSDSALTLSVLGTLGDVYLSQREPAQAEPLLREALAALEKNPSPRWRVEAARLQLGVALLRLGRFSDAEPLLVRSWETLQTLAATVPASVRRLFSEADDHLVELYTAWEKPDQLAAWRARLPARLGQQ